MNPAALLVLVALGYWYLSTRRTRRGPARNPYNRRRNPRLASLSGGGKYRTILVDPPWPAKEGNLRPEGVIRTPRVLRRVANSGYRPMDINAIGRLPVGELAARGGAHLYLWTTNGRAADAYRLLDQWGFRPQTMLTWEKPGHGLGTGRGYVNNSEQLIVARRGSLPYRNVQRGTVVHAPRQGRTKVAHRKPEVFRELIEKMSPGPRLELFARQGRPGWDVWGKQARAARNPRRPCCRCGSGAPCKNPYSQACALPGGHVFDFAAGGRCQCCGRMAPRRTVELEARSGDHARYGRTCAARSIGTTKLRTNQLEHMEREAAHRAGREAHYRGAGRQASGIVRPTFARGWSDADIVDLARRVGVSPFEPHWWLSQAANLVPPHYRLTPQGRRYVPATGEYRRFVTEGGPRIKQRRGAASSARSARPARGRAAAGYGRPGDDLPF